VFRQVVRWPLRSFLTSTGVGLAIGLMVLSLQWMDAIDHMIEVYFYDTQKQDLSVGLVEAESEEVVNDMERLPGVLLAEPVRTVAARLRVGNREKRVAIRGTTPQARLWPVYDSNGRIVPMPPDGLVLSTKLAEILGVDRGDMVTVEVMEGRRPVRRLPVMDTFETYIGTPAYMSLSAVNRMMREGPSTDLVHLQVDRNREPELFAKLKELPKVSAVTLRRAAVDMFDETMGEAMMIYVTIFTGFASALAFGVVYNSARIALSERGRELATLRVLGFTRGEISYILLGEVMLLIFLALPLGCLAGYGLVWLLSQSFDTELFRVPMFIENSTYGWAVLVGLAATVFSAAVVRRRVDRLDLIAVLKTRE
jgi:putative ABC transport system permease protein